MKTLNITLARFSDGSVDVDSSLDAAKSAILKHVAERETEQSTVAAAVSATFDTLKGARANMPYVVNATLRSLNAQPENFKALSELVGSYIRENAGDKDSGKLFQIGKGKGGGVIRHADQPAAPEAK